MSRLLVLPVYFFITLGLCKAQELKDLYSFPQQIPPAYKVDAKSEFDKMMKFRLEGLGSFDSERFAEIQCYGKKQALESGDLYYNWSELENYLNDILKRILPDSLKGNSNIHVYPTRDPEYNAYALYDGTILFNIGMLSGVVNEAAIAEILGHELAHYIHGDERRQFIANIKSFTKKNRVKEEVKLKRAHGDQQLEAEADETGYALAGKAGYDMCFGMNNYYTFLQEEEQQTQIEKTVHRSMRSVGTDGTSAEERKNEKMRELMSDHPKTQERIDNLKKYLESPNRKTACVAFLGDRAQFEKLRKLATLESLELLLNENDLEVCIERSFACYLLEPNNETWQYYLLESLRRKMYVDEDFGGKQFISAYYKKYFKENEGVLHNLHFVIRDSTRYPAIKDAALLDDKVIEFETNAQAFDYFSKAFGNSSMPEIYLTLALSESADKNKRNSYVAKYLASPGALHKEFAEKFRDDQLESALAKNNKETLVILDDLTFLEDHNYGYYNRRIMAEEKMPVFTSRLAELTKNKFQWKKVKSMDEVRNSDLANLSLYEQAVAAISIIYSNEEEAKGSSDGETYVIGGGDQPTEKKQKPSWNLFNYNPILWYLFKNNNVSAFEYIDAKSFDYSFELFFYAYDTRNKDRKDYFKYSHVFHYMSVDSFLDTTQKVFLTDRKK